MRGAMEDFGDEVLDLPFVYFRIAAGDRVRFVHDYYGGQWVILQHRFFFWDRKRVRLEPEEMLAVRDRLSGKRCGARNSSGLSLAPFKGLFGTQA